MVAATKQIAKVVTLLEYQQRLFLDTARVVVAVWCRQAGKDFTTACKAVTHALETGQDWYIVSVTQRQADATFAKCRRIAEAYKKILTLRAEIRYDDREFNEYDAWIDQHFRCTARTLHLPGGGSVTALPGRNPDTLAGLTGNVIFTEFGLFPKGGYEHWRVVFPLTTRGYQVIVISTPRGKNTKLYELYSDPETYSVHFLTIHDAVAGGLELTDNNRRPCSIEAFEKIYGDPVGWRREYLCEFTGDLEALVTWAQLLAAGEMGKDWPFDCLHVVREGPIPPGFWNRLRPSLAAGGRLEFGWDVARHRHLSVMWGNLAIPRLGRALRLLVVMQDVSFARQREILQSAMNLAPGAVGYGDSTGLGMDSNETLTARYPGRWFGLNFSGKAKGELGSILMTAYDEGSQAIPPTDGEYKYIATDVYAIQREGDRENLKLVESANPLWPDSHCDIAYANALALKAAQTIVQQGFLWVA